MKVKPTLYNPVLKRKVRRKIVYTCYRTRINNTHQKMASNVQHLDLPHFDRDSPDVFFNLFDAIMRNLSITDEKLTLYHLSRGIPQEIFELTLNDQYNALADKDKIIELKRLTIEECEKSKEEPYIRAHKLRKREDQTEPEFLRKLMTITRACKMNRN